MLSPFVAKPATPFAGTTTKERLAELTEQSDSSESPPRPGPDPKNEVDLDGRAMIPAGVIFAQPQTGTFRDRLGAVAVPIAVVGERYADADPDATVAPFLNPVPVMPFDTNAAPIRPAPLPLPPRGAESGGPDDTVMIRSPLAVVESAVGAPFNEQLTPPVVPTLTIDEYAQLRAELRYHGDEPRVWQRAGVTTVEGKAAIQAKYFELFRQHPVAQAEFQKLLRAHLSKLSAGEK